MKRKRIIAFLLIFFIVIPFIVSPLVTVIVYEAIFNKRYETPDWMTLSVDDFGGLVVERSDFASGGVTLAGYKYSKDIKSVKGVVIISHGLGGGGHNAFLPFVDIFTSNGYYVFTYDARGNDNSDGTVEGLPEGVISLNSAINHAKSIDEYKDLPIMLFGHSWGGYSVGNVLNLHPDIRAAVIIAGFNESEDMLKYQGEKYAKDKWGILLPYLKLYERIKFGKEFADTSAMQGMKSTDARIMIVHSKDDATVPTRFGYDKFYSEFGGNERFEFVLYEDKGHKDLLYSDDAIAYNKTIEEAYESYLKESGNVDSDKSKAEFMDKNLDKSRAFEANYILMQDILAMFDEHCK